MALQQRPHLLELFCQGVRIRGTAITHLRVSDMMNEPAVWMDMSTVELWPSSAGEQDEPERHELGRVRKSSIELASEAGDQPPRVDPQEFGFLVAKTPRRLLVLTANYAIRADLHVSTQTDVQTTLDVFKGRFLPLTTASVTAIGPAANSQPSGRRFLMVNLEMVNLVCDASEAPPPVFFPD
jgi:hypothetical protein